MLRIDRSETPAMAKVPTLALWELERLRKIDRVVRLGHLQQVRPGRLVLAAGEVAMARDAVVVHCAAPGLHYRRWCRSGVVGRSHCSPSGLHSLATVPLWPGTSRQRSKATPKRTGSAHLHRSRTHPLTGRTSRCSAGHRPSPSVPPSGSGRTGSRSTRDASHANWSAPPPYPPPGSVWTNTWGGAWLGWPSSLIWRSDSLPTVVGLPTVLLGALLCHIDLTFCGWTTSPEVVAWRSRPRAVTRWVAFASTVPAAAGRDRILHRPVR